MLRPEPPAGRVDQIPVESRRRRVAGRGVGGASGAFAPGLQGGAVELLVEALADCGFSANRLYGIAPRRCDTGRPPRRAACGGPRLRPAGVRRKPRRRRPRRPAPHPAGRVRDVARRAPRSCSRVSARSTSPPSTSNCRGVRTRLNATARRGDRYRPGSCPASRRGQSSRCGAPARRRKRTTSGGRPSCSRSVCDVDLDALDVALPRGFGRD